MAAKLRIFVEGTMPKNADELDDLNRALNALSQVHGVELGKIDFRFSNTSKDFSAFWTTQNVLPVNG